MFWGSRLCRAPLPYLLPPLIVQGDGPLALLPGGGPTVEGVKGLIAVLLVRVRPSSGAWSLGETTIYPPWLELWKVWKAYECERA